MITFKNGCFYLASSSQGFSFLCFLCNIFNGKKERLCTKKIKKGRFWELYVIVANSMGPFRFSKKKCKVDIANEI